MPTQIISVQALFPEEAGLIPLSVLSEIIRALQNQDEEGVAAVSLPLSPLAMSILKTLVRTFIQDQQVRDWALRELSKKGESE